MPNREQEVWCLERLKAAIRDQHPGATLPHERGRPDPPDFWLNVNGRRFAVEVSRIQLGKDQTKWQSLCNLVRQIKSNAIAAGELSGRYIAEACGELPPVRRAKKALAAGIRACLRDTKTASSCPKRELRVDGMLFGHIHKYAPDGAKLYLMGGLTNTGACESEIRPELKELLNERISEKRKKLADCPDPTILLLEDCYGLEEDTAGFVQRIKESPDTSFFHAVFLIHRMGDEVFAHQSGPLLG